MSDYGHVKHNLKKAKKELELVKDPGLAKGLKSIVKSLNRMNNQIHKLSKKK